MNDMDTTADKPLRVTVLCGGTSGEREISLRSGANVANALRDAGFEVDMLDPADDDWITALAINLPDVVFPMLHGRGGEDGTVQGLCELLGVPYVGSGVLASSTALDKGRTKQIYASLGLLTPSCCVIRKGNPYSCVELIQNLGSCLVVKPAIEGSSLGLTIVHSTTPEELQAAIDKAFALDDQVIVEQYISGTEVTVPVLGNAQPRALPTIEIVPAEGHEFYDFDAKYAPGGSSHIIPSRLGDSLNAELMQVAEHVHAMLGCRGFSRTDFIVTIDGDSKMRSFLIETNTIPGMTDTSLVPDAARHIGIEMPELVTMLVNYALED
jgi:D-alanine-D-alanine ligase